MKNKVFINITICSVKEKFLLYIILILTNCLFYCECFLYNVFFIEDLTNYRTNRVSNLSNILCNNFASILIGIGIIILCCDIFNVILLKNNTIYNILYENGSSKKVIFLHKLIEYIITDTIGFILCIIVLFCIKYNMSNYDFVLYDFLYLFLIYVLIKHTFILFACLFTNKLKKN